MTKWEQRDRRQSNKPRRRDTETNDRGTWWPTRGNGKDKKCWKLYRDQQWRV